MQQVQQDTSKATSTLKVVQLATNEPSLQFKMPPNLITLCHQCNTAGQPVLQSIIPMPTTYLSCPFFVLYRPQVVFFAYHRLFQHAICLPDIRSWLLLSSTTSVRMPLLKHSLTLLHSYQREVFQSSSMCFLYLDSCVYLIFGAPSHYLGLYKGHQKVHKFVTKQPYLFLLFSAHLLWCPLQLRWSRSASSAAGRWVMQQ